MSNKPSKLSASARQTLAVTGLVGVAILLYSVRAILPPFLIAVGLAYALNPVVDVLMRLTRRSRRTAVAILYIILLLILTLTIVLIVPTLFRQVRAINVDLEAISNQVRALLESYQQVEIAGFALDPLSLLGEVRGAAQSIATFLASRTTGLVVGVLSGLVWIILILLVSFYVVKDAPQIHRFMHDRLPQAYQADFMRLSGAINSVLNAYLRGQVALCLVVGVGTGIALAVVGVRHALLLGILAGVLELVPTIGPVIAAIPAIAIALFQGSTHLTMERHWFALLVVALYAIIQQVENSVLVPRIIGSSVNLHPVVVIFGALAGAAMAGLVGVFLAIPLIAVGRIIIGYVYEKVR